MFRISIRSLSNLLAVSALALVFAGAGVHAQSLNWEGQTGVFVTPLAYTAPSGKGGIGRPIVAYHYLNAGEVLGGFHTASVTVGLGGEDGVRLYPHLPPAGRHGRPEPVVERRLQHRARQGQPGAGERQQAQLGAGAVGRFCGANPGRPRERCSGRTKKYNNGDFYLVATKTVTQVRGLPLVLNLGYKATNARSSGWQATRPAYKGRLFGAAAFVVKGPAKSQLIFGSEFAQQPREVQNLPGADGPHHHHLRGPHCPPARESQAQHRFRRGAGGRQDPAWRRPEGAPPVRVRHLVRTLIA